MDAKQALNILFQASGMAGLSREGHEQVTQAAQVLNELVEAQPDAPAEEPKVVKGKGKGELAG